MSDTVVSCEGMYAGYGKEVVLKDVNIVIEAGDFLPVVGPNGAGKTTLLRCILGLIKPMAGKLVTDFSRYPPAYVPQNRIIDPLFPLTAEQIVISGLYRELSWWKRPTEEQLRRVRGMMERLRLLPFKEKNYRELSGGTQQKVLVARALVSNALVLILDEPTSELDADSEREIFEVLLHENRENGRTIVFACHGVDVKVFGAEKVCSVERGRVSLKACGKGDAYVR